MLKLFSAKRRLFWSGRRIDESARLGPASSPDPQMIYDSFSDVGESRVWFASASDPFFGLFWVISEVGSQIYIANLAIFKI